jgi:spectinomycin phosphotransferase
METKPDIDERALVTAVRSSWGVHADAIDFLPLGADVASAAWRVSVAGDAPLFLKTRFGAFDPAVLGVPRFLRDSGIAEVLAPLSAQDGALAVRDGGVTLILYPFVEGSDGFATPLGPKQWTELGAALRRIHGTDLPAGIARAVDTERYAPRWRDAARRAAEHGDARRGVGDPIGADLAKLLAARRDDIALMADRAEALAERLKASPKPFVLCHTDLHAWNVIVGTDGSLHIVDWDSPRFAPKERDLMFVGGGVGGVWNTAAETEAFYAGYGASEIDPVALAYYRYERIVEDIAVDFEQVLDATGDHRAVSLAQLAAQWQPGGVVDIAHATYARLGRA